jgi:translation initiation factor IF-1
MSDNKDNKKEEGQVEGTVIEALPEATFKVLVDGTEEEILTYLAGKMKIRRIRVLVGDRVLMQTDPYGGKARIFRRL